jgi:hypothetical protein
VLLLDLRREPGRIRTPEALRDVVHRRVDLRQTIGRDHHQRQMHGFERMPQIGMRVGGARDDEIGMQRHDLLDVRLDAADAREPVHRFRIVGEAVDADDLRSAAERKEHFGDVGSEGDDAMNGVRSFLRLDARKEQKRDEG